MYPFLKIMYFAICGIITLAEAVSLCVLSVWTHVYAISIPVAFFMVAAITFVPVSVGALWMLRPKKNETMQESRIDFLIAFANCAAFIYLACAYFLAFVWFEFALSHPWFFVLVAAPLVAVAVFTFHSIHRAIKALELTDMRKR